MNNYLKRIRIQRFRSITDQTIDLAPITVFVGANDSGKSNILKAINLLFNGEVVSGSGYNHRRDFSKIAPKRPRKADEVTITATIVPPVQHQDCIITWRQDWRDYDYHKPHFPVYNPVPKKYSKVPVWWERLNYRYVPANKGDAYMKDLMRELYDFLATTVDARIRFNAKNFIDDIRKHTAQISEGIKDALDLDSWIQLPDDLSSLFELFDFETNGKISLGQRGDGIRARHIPVILGYLADRKNQAKGTVRGNTIWGYEEPENNIEMGAAFKQAEQLADYAERNHIQILMTTHSPAFYGLGDRPNVMVYHVRNEGGQAGGHTVIKEAHDSMDVDRTMGILDIVTPRIRGIVKELEEQKALIRQIEGQHQGVPPVDKPVIFVEGKSDEMIINACVHKMFPNKKHNFHVYAVQGVAKMPDIMVAMKSLTKTDKPVKFIGLLDNDEEGREAQKRCKERGIEGKLDAKYQSFFVNMPKIFRDAGVQDRHAVNCLEHLLPLFYWEEAKQHGFLVKSGKTLISIEHLDLFPHSNGERDIRLSHTVQKEHKAAFAEFVVRKIAEDGVPDDLQEQVQKLINKLKI